MLEQAILDIIQDGFPIVDRPYAELARILSAAHPRENDASREIDVAHPREDDAFFENQITERSVFDAVERLRSSGVIRRIGGVYDSRKLGFVSRLVAGKVPASNLDFLESSEGRAPTAMEIFAAAVNKIPSITHNYVRDHEYNVWFTVIAESEHEVSAIIDRLCAETALHDVHVLPATRMIKINTVMGKKNDVTLEPSPVSGLHKRVGEPSSVRTSLAIADKLRIRLLSGDLPHTLTPFVDVFAMLQSQMRDVGDFRDVCDFRDVGDLRNCLFDVNDFLALVRDDLASKRMRRFGAVLRHQNAGFTHNAMVCFCVDDGALATGGLSKFDSRESFLAGLASNPRVSHCYERPPFEGFPYNIYAMFHATSAEELDQAISDSVQNEKSIKFEVLRSLKELKKTSFCFFCK